MMEDLPKDRIEELIRQRRWTELKEKLIKMPAPELADLLMSLDKPARVLLFRLLPRSVSAMAFSHLESKDKDILLKDLTDHEARQLLDNLSPDDRTDFFEDMPGQVIQRLINLLSPDERRKALQLLGYPAESVGRLMTPDYVAVRPDWTVKQALDHIRTKGRDSETINVIYVTDASWKLLDALELRRFILADPANTVQQIMDYSFISISAFDDREEAVHLIQRYDLDALPVVDPYGVLLGIVTVDDVLDVAQEEATEDFHKTAAVAPLKVSYREVGMWMLYRKRIGWLVALVIVNLASSGVIAAYEETLAAAIVLAFFIPLLIDSGGNTGAQSATLMIRAIATGDVKIDQWLKAVSKELGVGITLGITMGLAGFVIGFLRGGLEIGIVVGLSMLIIVIFTNLIGIALPFLLVRLRLDPAVASSPLITSISDITGLIIYFSTAAWILGILR
ncbi:MAG: magnesium transporter [Candidatus Methanoperedens sp.]|nr:magnesium transporter [Candidatus Methanoperedens nitroreducens]MDJ1422631.1 magnesium transporter [Candidatus Methanoperedens sp.]